jgi:hypothetical protein
MIVMVAMLVTGAVHPYWVDKDGCHRAQEALKHGARVELTVQGGAVVVAERIACVPLAEFVGVEVTQ